VPAPAAGGGFWPTIDQHWYAVHRCKREAIRPADSIAILSLGCRSAPGCALMALHRFATDFSPGLWDNVFVIS